MIPKAWIDVIPCEFGGQAAILALDADARFGDPHP
jgi:hypothetical protein